MAGGKQKQPTVSTDSVAQDQIRAFVERVERIEQEVKDLNRDKSEIFAEAKGNGFDVKVLKIVVGIRRKDHAERMEQDALVELYMAALEGVTYRADDDEDETGTVNALTRAPAQPNHEPADPAPQELRREGGEDEPSAIKPVLFATIQPETANATQPQGHSGKSPTDGGENVDAGAHRAGASDTTPAQSNVVTLKSYANDPPHPDCLKPSLCKGYSNIKLCQPCIDAAAGSVAVEAGGVQIPHRGDVA